MIWQALTVKWQDIETLQNSARRRKMKKKPSFCVQLFRVLELFYLRRIPFISPNPRPTHTYTHFFLILPYISALGYVRTKWRERVSARSLYKYLVYRLLFTRKGLPHFKYMSSEPAPLNIVQVERFSKRLDKALSSSLHFHFNLSCECEDWPQIGYLSAWDETEISLTPPFFISSLTSFNIF